MMGCPALGGGLNATESALWACAESAVDTALFAFVAAFIFILLLAAYWMVFWMMLARPR